MILVTATLIPADTLHSGGGPEQIGSLLIVNDGTGSIEKGNYVYRLDEHDLGFVHGHDRKQNVWKLISKCLERAKKK